MVVLESMVSVFLCNMEYHTKSRLKPKSHNNSFAHNPIHLKFCIGHCNDTIVPVLNFKTIWQLSNEVFKSRSIIINNTVTMSRCGIHVSFDNSTIRFGASIVRSLCKRGFRFRPSISPWESACHKSMLTWRNETKYISENWNNIKIFHWCSRLAIRYLKTCRHMFSLKIISKVLNGVLSTAGESAL